MLEFERSASVWVYHQYQGELKLFKWLQRDGPPTHSTKTCSVNSCLKCLHHPKLMEVTHVFGGQINSQTVSHAPQYAFEGFELWRIYSLLFLYLPLQRSRPLLRNHQEYRNIDGTFPQGTDSKAEDAEGWHYTYAAT